MKILIAIPACRNLQYGQWESTRSPHFDKNHAYLNQGYGTNIHTSGPNERIQAIRDTWAKDVPPEMDLRFFFGSRSLGFLEAMQVEDEILLDCQNDYAHLPDKVFAIVRWALAEGYDYILKCDDDTYVWPERALEEIRFKQWDYAGYSAHLGSISGGPGYWLSKRAMALVAESEPHTWAEDKCVEEVMSRNHVKAIQLNATHLCGLIEHWVDISRDLSGAVTAHAVKAEDMRAIYAREHANRP